MDDVKMGGPELWFQGKGNENLELSVWNQERQGRLLMKTKEICMCFWNWKQESIGTGQVLKKKNGYPPRKTFAFCHYCVLDQSRGAPKTCWRLFPNDWFHQRRTFLIAARRHGVTFPLGKNKTKLLQQTLRCRERWVTWRFFPQIVHSPTSCKTSDSLSKIDGFWMFWHLLFRTKTPKGESWSAWWKIH